MALVLQSLDQHYLDVTRDASSTAAVGVSTITRPARCTGILQGSQRSLLRAPTGSSTTPAVSRGSCLVALDGRVGSAIIGQPLQHYGLDSPGSH
jgi:hypothetical protein